MSEVARSVACLPKVPFTEVRSPGVYLTPKGELFRLTDSSEPELRQLLRLWGTLAGSEVTRISDDPHEPVRECRRLASSAGLPARF